MCSIDGCDKPRYMGKYLMCGMHYKRKLRHGSPHQVLRVHGNNEKRAWSYVDKTDSCWIWTGPKTRTYDGRPNPSFYGYIEINGKNIRAHRYIYSLVVGPIPEGLTLDHVAEKCSNTLCVNPEHLEPVTSAENTRRYFAQFNTCRNGHEYTPENTYTRPDSKTRQCRQCRRDRRALSNGS